MKKAALHNLGCKVNAYETEAMQQLLEEAGYEIVPFSEKADVYVINTCSVTNIADRKSRQMLHRAKKQNPEAIVIGAGCYIQTREAEALADSSIDLIIGNNEKSQLVQKIREYEAGHRKNEVCFGDDALKENPVIGVSEDYLSRDTGFSTPADGGLATMPADGGLATMPADGGLAMTTSDGGLTPTPADPALVSETVDAVPISESADSCVDSVPADVRPGQELPAGTVRNPVEKKMDLYHAINRKGLQFEELPLSQTEEHTRAFIKIQDGCNQFCSYCIIPFARGRVRSRKPENIIAEVKRLAEKGFQEIVLTGIHLSSYGTDTGDGLLDVIGMINRIEGVKRIRLGSLEPRLVTEEFTRTLASYTKICPHFHLSLQSGCDDTLKRMNRRYTTEEYYHSCEILRKYFDHPAITTDVIVGFPGEKPDEFEQTVTFLQKVHFYEMHIFKYSVRQGTKAAGMRNQIPEPVKTKRSARLIELGNEMSEEFRDYWIGKDTEVLFEEPCIIDGAEYYSGYTREYVKVVVPSEKDLSNRILPVRITRKLKDVIYLGAELQ